MIARPMERKARAALPLAAAVLLSTVAVASAHAAYHPIVPKSWAGPNPKHNCVGGPLGGLSGAGGIGVYDLDSCGARMEGLAPLPLPANWRRLSTTWRGFVLIELERIERREQPIVGISRKLDENAMQGAKANTDPSGGASIWSSGDFVDDGMPGWMYDDGPGGYNEACQGKTTWGCWGHRDNILESASDPNIDIGVAEAHDDSSAAAVFADGEHDLVFTWAQELREGYPHGLPTSFALKRIRISRVSTERSGEVKVTGAALDTATALWFGHRVERHLQGSCTTESICTFALPDWVHAGRTYAISVSNPAGRSAASKMHG